MGALLSTIRSTLNLLLPFTSTTTPLAQDLIHTAILIATFYYGPQIADYYNTHYASHRIPTTDAPRTEPGQNGAPEDLPVDENLVLQPDDTDNDNDDALDPPPLAPTPPPGLGLPRDADAEAQWQAHVGDADGAGAQPGPADRPRPTPANRVIGAKKAKSLARRDQRRAYHEFHRAQAEERKREEAEGKEEREAILAAERAARAEVERAIVEKKRAEVGRRKEEERRELEEERERRERVVDKVRGELEGKGAVDLVDVAWEEGKDRVWIERLVRASGMMAQMEQEGQRVMITMEGWIVRLDQELMQRAYADAMALAEGEKQDGRLAWDDFGTILENAVRARAAAA